MPKDRGFTLIEMMVTVMVMAIALTIAIPSFNNTIRNSQLASASNQLVGSLQQARSEAIKRRATLYLQAGGSSAAWANGWSIASVDSSVRDGETVETVTRLLNFDPPAGTIRISAASGNTSLTRLGFNRNGELTGVTTASFSVCVTGKPEGRSVSLNRFGRVIVSATACS